MDKVTYFGTYRYRGVVIRTYIHRGIHFANYRIRKDCRSKTVHSSTWFGVRGIAERAIHGELEEYSLVH
jgi:hypothetical protein